MRELNVNEIESVNGGAIFLVPMMYYGGLAVAHYGARRVAMWGAGAATAWLAE